MCRYLVLGIYSGHISTRITRSSARDTETWPLSRVTLAAVTGELCDWKIFQNLISWFPHPQGPVIGGAGGRNSRSQGRGRGRGLGHLIEISPCPQQCPVSTLPPPTWTQTPLLSLTLLPRNNEENKLKFWFKMNHHLEKIESSENLACLCFAWNINEEVFKKMCTCDKVWSPFRFKTVKRCSSDDYVYSYGSIRTMK